MKRLIVVALLAVATAAWGIQSMGRAQVEWAAVERGELVLEVELGGLLRADHSESIGPPPIRRVWRYKIAFLIDEGTEVTAGDKVLSFDTTELRRKLEEKKAEMESAAKHVEKEQTNLAIRIRDDKLAIEEAEARRRKSELKLDIPSGLTRALETEKTQIDLEIGEQEIVYLEARARSGRRSGESAIAFYEDKRERARGRVEEIEAAIARMTITAGRDGIVVYVADERGQKKKSGDSCWVGEKVLEIPDLNQMHGEGEVAEAEAGRVVEQARVRLFLDAYPDDQLAGRVKTIQSLVRRKSPDVPLKVVRAEVSLDETDPERMRPGMRFRGWIETERVENCRLVPTEAVFATPNGPIAYRKTLTGYETVSIKTGRRSKEQVEVVAGLDDGDEVALVDLGGES